MFGHRFKDKDVESLLSGRIPEDQDLADLVPFADSLRRAGGRIPSEAHVATFAEHAAKISRASTEDAAAGARRPAASPHRRPGRLSPRLAGITVLIVALLSTTGVAVAANGAVPGDTLYGFDQALERIGLGDGGLKERLTEASVLADRGSVEKGLAHASQAVASSDELADGAQQTEGALVAANNALMTAGDDQVAQVRVQIAEMLRWMATTEAQGSDFGQGAVEFARRLGPGGEGSPGGSPTQTTGADAQGQSGQGSGSSAGTQSTAGTGGTPQGAPGTQDGTQGPGPGSTTGVASTTTTTHPPTTDAGGHPGDSTPSSSSSTITSYGGQGNGSGGNPPQGGNQP